MGVLRARAERAVRAPSRGPSRSRCRRCRSSTPTTRRGSAVAARARCCEAAGWLLARTLAGAPRAAGAADRPAAAGACRTIAGAAWRVELDAELTRGAAGAGPAAGRDAVHDAAGRLGRAAARAARGRTTSWSARRWRTAGGAEIGGADRLLRQHAGAAHRPRRRPAGRASCWRGCGRRRWALRAPGPAVRAGWWRRCSRSATWSHARSSR